MKILTYFFLIATLFAVIDLVFGEGLTALLKLTGLSDEKLKIIRSVLKWVLFFVPITIFAYITFIYS